MQEFLLKKIADATTELHAITAQMNALRERQTILGAHIDAWKIALDAVKLEVESVAAAPKADDQNTQTKKRGRRPNRNWIELLRICDGLTIQEIIAKAEPLGLKEKAVRDQFRRYVGDNVTTDAENKYWLTEKARKNISAQSETASGETEAVLSNNQAAASGTQSEGEF